MSQCNNVLTDIQNIQTGQDQNSNHNNDPSFTSCQYNQKIDDSSNQFAQFHDKFIQQKLKLAQLHIDQISKLTQIRKPRKRIDDKIIQQQLNEQYQSQSHANLKKIKLPNNNNNNEAKKKSMKTIFDDKFNDLSKDLFQLDLDFNSEFENSVSIKKNQSQKKKQYILQNSQIKNNKGMIDEPNQIKLQINGQNIESIGQQKMNESQKENIQVGQQEQTNYENENHGERNSKQVKILSEDDSKSIRKSKKGLDLHQGGGGGLRKSLFEQFSEIKIKDKKEIQTEKKLIQEQIEQINIEEFCTNPQFTKINNPKFTEINNNQTTKNNKDINHINNNQSDEDFDIINHIEYQNIDNETNQNNHKVSDSSLIPRNSSSFFSYFKKNEEDKNNSNGLYNNKNKSNNNNYNNNNEDDNRDNKDEINSFASDSSEDSQDYSRQPKSNPINDAICIDGYNHHIPELCDEDEDKEEEDDYEITDYSSNESSNMGSPIFNWVDSNQFSSNNIIFSQNNHNEFSQNLSSKHNHQYNHNHNPHQPQPFNIFNDNNNTCKNKMMFESSSQSGYQSNDSSRNFNQFYQTNNNNNEFNNKQSQNTFGYQGFDKGSCCSDEHSNSQANYKMYPQIQLSQDSFSSNSQINFQNLNGINKDKDMNQIFSQNGGNNSQNMFISTKENTDSNFSNIFYHQNKNLLYSPQKLKTANERKVLYCNNKQVPKWAYDLTEVANQVRQQNKIKEDPIKIFGSFSVENLNLRAVFQDTGKKYDQEGRGSSANWKQDLTPEQIEKLINATSQTPNKPRSKIAQFFQNSLSNIKKKIL